MNGNTGVSATAVGTDDDAAYAHAAWGLTAVSTEGGRLEIRLVDTPSAVSLCVLDMPTTMLAVRQILDRGGATTAMFHSAPPVKSPLGQQLAPGRVRLIAHLVQWPTAEDIAELHRVDVEFIHGRTVVIPGPGATEWIAVPVPRRSPTVVHAVASIRAYTLVRRHM